MSDAPPAAQYTMRLDEYGFWTVLDAVTVQPVKVRGVVQRTTDVSIADDIVDMLNGEIDNEATLYIRAH